MQELQPNTTLQNGKYRIERVLGQGGFGITYLATDIALDRKVAIKEFFPKDYCGRNGSTSHVTLGTESAADFVQRLKAKFLKEVRNIAKLDHPGIIRIYAAFEENNTAYYVMEYIEDENLAEMVNRNGRLSEAKAIHYIEKVGEALKYIHDRKINHLDIKPANIMVRREDDRPILIDFGLSKQYDTDGQQTSTTPTGISHGYAPMEQYNDGGVKEFSPQTDIYSLAATLYFLLSGITPPQATRLIDEELDFPQSIPTSLIAPISKGMATSRKQRYDVVGKFLADLTIDENTIVEFVPPTPVQTAPVQPAKPSAPQPKPNQKLAKRNGLMKWGGIAAFAIIAVTGIIYVGINVLKYDKVGIYSEGLTMVKRFGKYGYIDRTGEIVIPVRYDSIGRFYRDLAKVKQNNKYGYVDITGKEITLLQYDKVFDFSNGFAKVMQNGKYGYIDKTGKEITPLKYDEVFDFSNGLAKVKQNKKYGYIDEMGKEVIAVKYKNIGNFSDGLVSVYNGRCGYADKTGKEVIPLKYDVAYNFSYGRAVVKQRGKYGYIDKTGREITPLKYDEACNFSGGFAEVKQNGKYGYIDKTGQEVVPLKYDEVYGFSDGLAKVRQRRKYGYVNETGEEVIPLEYDEAWDFYRGRAHVRKMGESYYIDETGFRHWDW